MDKDEEIRYLKAIIVSRPVNKIEFGKLYKKTLKNKSDLINLGYKVIFIWESNFKNGGSYGNK
jgi:G:T-mismatch repair DNA endonuclease (very short patch repair protein)